MLNYHPDADKPLTLLLLLAQKYEHLISSLRLDDVILLGQWLLSAKDDNQLERLTDFVPNTAFYNPYLFLRLSYHLGIKKESIYVQLFLIDLQRYNEK